MKFNDLHKLLEESVVNEGLMDFLKKMIDIAKAIIPEEYYMYPGMKQFEEAMRARHELHNEQNYSEKWSDHKKKESYDTMEEACQAIDQSLQAKSRKKFSEWFVKKMQTIYTSANINITTKNPKDTINNSYIMFGEFVNPMLSVSILSNPKIKTLLDKFFIDYNMIDPKHFDIDLVTDPTKSGMKNWVYDKNEIQKIANYAIKNMTTTSSVDNKIFTQALTLCFTSIKDDGKSTSFISNLDFIIMSMILAIVFKPAYTQYLTKSKLTKLEDLCNNNKSDYDLVVTPYTPSGGADPRVKPANNILRNFSALINDLKTKSSIISDKLYDQYEVNKKLSILTDNVNKISRSVAKVSSASDVNKIVNAKAAWDLGFELYSLIKVEEEKLVKLDKIFDEIATELATFPTLVDRADVDASQNFIIPKIKKS